MTETNRTKVAHWTRSLFWGAAFVLMVAVGIVLLAWNRVSSQDTAARSEIQKRLAAIRHAGQPVNMLELARLYPDPPPSQDALILLKPALALLVIPKDSTNLPFFGGEFPGGNVPLQKATTDEIRVSQDKNQAAMDSVRWDKQQGTWIGSGFRNGFTNLAKVPISEIDSLIKILCLNASLQAENHQSKEAAQSLQHALEIEQMLRSDTILHALAKEAIETWVCDTLNRVLNRTSLADSDLQLISGFLTRNNLGTTKQLLVNERAFGLSIAEDFQSLAVMAGQTHSLSPVRRFLKSYQSKLIYRDQDLLDYLNKVEAEFPALDLPLSNAIPLLMDIEKKSKKANHAMEKQRGYAYLSPFKEHRVSPLSVTTPTEASSLLKREAQTLAFVQVTRTAIAIERWRLAHDGRVPESLAALAPDFLSSAPTDPFDGQPLRYKVLEHGYVVYSLGFDFKDDGGKRGDLFGKDNGYDIVFSVAR